MIIRAAPDAVFRWIEEPGLASRWQRDVAEYEITRPSVDVVGTEFREVLRSATGSMEMHGRITGYVKNERMEFALTGSGIRLRIRYTVSGSSDGAQLDVDAEIQVGGRLRWVIEPLVRRRMVRQFDSELARLREFAEAS